MGKIMASQQLSGRQASMARRQMQVNGKATQTSAAPVRPVAKRERKAVVPEVAAPTVALSASQVPPKLKTIAVVESSARVASRKRREAASSRGKVGVKSTDRQRGVESALRGRKQEQAKSDCGCGGECCKKSEATNLPLSVPPLQPAGGLLKKRVVVADSTGRLVSKARRNAASSKGKAGLDAHRKGISSASLARQANPDISSRELARAVRDQRSRSGAQGSSGAQAVRRQRPRNAAEAMRISGTKVDHSEKLTGDEAGLCNTGVTGTEYMAAEIFDKFCQAEPPKARVKVEATETLSGSHITSGGMVGGSAQLTGIDQGSCQEVTGSEYLGREHFVQQCEVTPPPVAAKVSHSQTSRGTVISGPKSSRSDKVSGNEKGTCEAVTGTPYAGVETFESFCSSDQQREERMRTVMPVRQGAGRDISGVQPGLTGKGMTGAEEGACQPVSGTPYIAESELKAVCSAEPASVGDSDFPQPLGAAAVAGDFSVMPTVAGSAAVAAPRVDEEQSRGAVTGSGYEGNGAVTGAFSMGKGKVTGTEQSRFGGRAGNVVELSPKKDEGEKASRVTGEGIDTGLNITGNDWDRGDRVTGTEGGSATQRNPTRRGPMSAMPEVAAKREPKVERPSANVTGGSGGSEGPSAITVSGGARG